MERTETFRIRTYGWGELASYYSPGININSATRRFREWINLNPELVECLMKAGWRENKRVLTPLQVEIIVKYLGEP